MCIGSQAVFAQFLMVLVNLAAIQFVLVAAKMLRPPAKSLGALFCLGGFQRLDLRHGGFVSVAQIVIVLQIQPELCRQPKILPEAESCIG
jgi:hypothetical protein